MSSLKRKSLNALRYNLFFHLSFALPYPFAPRFFRFCFGIDVVPFNQTFRFSFFISFFPFSFHFLLEVCSAVIRMDEVIKSFFICSIISAALSTFPPFAFFFFFFFAALRYYYFLIKFFPFNFIGSKLKKMCIEKTMKSSSPTARVVCFVLSISLSLNFLFILSSMRKRCCSI